MSTTINNTIACNEPHASLDSYYGPYNSVKEACDALTTVTVLGHTYTMRHVGLTVGIIDSNTNKIVEYWFNGGTDDENLVEKVTSSGSGLPEGVKIVTFDKNGGSGVQNSIITDTTSQVVLPECTLTKTGETFSCWSYNGTQKNPGQTITVGSTTVVQAQWSSSPTPKPSHVITWSAGTGINKITGTANGVEISSGDRVKEDSTIVLTATKNSGYNFSQWSGLPSGTSSNNPVTFTMGTSDIAVTATAVVTKYTIGWSGSNVTIDATDGNDTPLTNGSQYASGTTVKMRAQADAGYDFEKWEGVPNSVADPTQSSITFTLDNNYQNIVAKTKATPVESGFYYYGCGSGKDENEGGGEKGGEYVGDGEDPINGETGSKWFNDVEELISSNKQTSVTIDNSEAKYTILYVVRDTNTAPTCTYDRGDSVIFVPVNECSDGEIYNHFVEVNMIESNTNQTLGDLATKGAYMFVLIDSEKVLADKTFTISITSKA